MTTEDKMKVIYAKLHLMQVMINENRKIIFPEIGMDEFLPKQVEEGSRREMKTI